MAWETIPNAHIGDVVAARARQRAHDDAELLVGMVHLARSTPLDELDGAEIGPPRRMRGRPRRSPPY
ncbi:hypothetical protein [Pseudonocardia sp. GCM10023141]|uniref:hypothetical protein n=1 Tax=Pseudonocardia sp. GCM10023141 TaxID=3252653 RepID=UPI003617960F